MRWLHASEASSVVPAATCDCQPALGSDVSAGRSVVRAAKGRERRFEPVHRIDCRCEQRVALELGCGTAIAQGAGVQPNCSARSLLGDSRGAVTVEYLIVFSFVGLTTAAGIAAAAPALVRHYSAQRAMFYQSYP